MTVTREIQESPTQQGVDEEVVYTLTTTPWGSDPSTDSVKVYDVTDGYASKTDVTSTVMPTGSASESGDVISLPKMKSLTAGSRYRVEIEFTCSGNTFVAWGVVEGEN